MERLAMGQAGLRELVDEDLDLCRDHRLPATVRPLGRDRFIGGAAVQLVDDEPLPLAPRRRLPPGLLRGHGRAEHVRDDLVDCGDGCWCQVSGSSQVLIHLLPAPRPCQHHGDAGPGQEPAECQPREGGVEALGQRPQSLDHTVPPLELRPPEPVDVPPVVVLRELGWLRVRAGEESRGEGPVGEECEPALAGQRQLALLYVAVEQIVGPLIADERRELRGAGDLQVGRVAEADPQGFPFLPELEQLLERPLPAPQRFVQLDEVHVIAREAAQGPLEGGARIVVRADLRRDRDARAMRPERAAEQVLGLAVAVGRRRVEECDAALERAPNRGFAFGGIARRSPAPAPYRPRAEPEARLGRYETRRGPDVSPGPRVHRTAPLGVAGRLELARLDDLGTMTAGDEFRGLDDLHRFLQVNWTTRKTAVWSILRVAVEPVNR